MALGIWETAIATLSSYLDYFLVLMVVELMYKEWGIPFGMVQQKLFVVKFNILYLLDYQGFICIEPSRVCFHPKPLQKVIEIHK